MSSGPSKAPHHPPVYRWIDIDPYGPWHHREHHGDRSMCTSSSGTSLMVAASFQSAGLHETAGSRRETGMLRLQQVLRMMLVGLLFLQRVAASAGVSSGQHEEVHEWAEDDPPAKLAR
eukprot:s1613_g14.t1